MDCVTQHKCHYQSSEIMEPVLNGLQSNFMVLLQKNMKPIVPVHAALQQ